MKKVPQVGGGELMRQAARLQRRMEEVRGKLKDREVTATSVGDRISVTVTCEGRLRKIALSPALLESEGLDMSLDLIVAGVNAALELADKTAQAELDQVTGGMKIPGVTR